MAEYEEFRDNYKNQRQSNDQRLKLNGATFRNIRNLSKIGNLITKTEVADAEYNESLAELEARYDINRPEVVYSLNKKKRWEVGPALVNHMKEFTDEDQDVRIYETRNRYTKKANCVAVHRSKGDKLSVKSTYANINSIKHSIMLDEQAEKNPKPQPTTTTTIKEVKSSKKSKNVKSILVQEEIVIDESVQNRLDPYIQYDIEYSPKRDILKYGAKKVNSTGIVSGSRSQRAQLKNISDDARDILDDEEYYSSEEEEEAVEATESQQESDEEFQIPLEDLIYNYAKLLSEKQEKIQQANKEKIREEAEILEAKDKKIFVNRSEFLQFQKIKYENLDSKKSANQNKFKVGKAVPTSLLLEASSIDSATLKETFGDKYSEADNCWPRLFNINLSKKIVDAVELNHSLKKAIDVRVWLTFKQEIGRDSVETMFEDNSFLFTVSVCSNMCKKVDLTPIDTSKSWNIQDLCETVVNHLASMHIDSFLVAESVARKVGDQYRIQSEDLPNIAEKVATKSFEDLKLEMVNKSAASAVTGDTPKLERMNSKQVTKIEQDFLEQEKSQARLDKIFSEKRFDCAICYTQHDDLTNCVIIKTCGHGFCKPCVKSYADYELKNAFLKAGKFCCPSCDNDLGLALLINLASNAQEVDIYIQQTLERIYFVLSNYKWCPSANCSKILQVDLTSNPCGTVSCSCGFQVCLKCNNKPHFPAKCSQIANYYKQLKTMDEFYFDDSIYNSRGKKCPKCQVFMEKNGGCNQMVCTLCKETFCWNCVRLWKDHLKLSNGQHACTANANQMSVTVKVQNAKPVSNKLNAYEDSFVHRRMRKVEQRKQRSDGAKRLFSTIKRAHFDESLGQAPASNEDKSAEQTPSWTESVIEKGNAYIEWRKEIRVFLDNLLSLVNELHFVCEHGHLSLKDSSLQKDVRFQLSGLIRSLEIIIWGIEYHLAEGKGIKAVHQLRQLYQKGLNCITALKNIKLD